MPKKQTFYQKYGKEIREWGFFVLALGTLMIGISSLIFQINSNPQIEPKVIVNLVDSNSFTADRLSLIYVLENGTFGISKEYLNFEISNLGQKSTNYMNFYVEDPNGEYTFGDNSIKNLGSLQNTFFQIPIWSENCSQVYMDSLGTNESGYEILRKCEKISDNLTRGNNNLILRVDCPGCGFANNERCYSFNICVYDYSSNVSCVNNNRVHDLTETHCPNYWPY